MAKGVIQDRAGESFHQLVVESFSHKVKRPSGQYAYYWNCICSCGCETKVASSKFGRTKSCGCIEEIRKHGYTAKDPTYISWMSMRQRCLYEKHIYFHNYGGRGIKICDRWNSFKLFLLDMGERPEGKTLDRIDNDKGYCPENCRWASKAEQEENKR